MTEPKKINEYSWKIEKEGNMNVPIIVFASDKIMKKILEDKTIEQAKNMASLPGVVKNVIVCPDAHQGYGACIGGVAAFDTTKGLISPGMVGFDINCTHPETRVTLKNGTWMRMNNIEDVWNSIQLKYSNLRSSSIRKTNLVAYMKKPHRGVLYEITSKTGHTLKVTGDHPIYTQNGMKNAKELTRDDVIQIYSFQGLEYEEPSNEIILTEKDIEKVIEKFGITNVGNGKKQVMNHLRKLDILPLRYNSPELPVLLKVIGYIIGDGVLYFSKLGNIQLYGKKEDLETIKSDLKEIGIHGANIYERNRDHKITTKYGTQEFSTIEFCLQKKATNIFALLVALGCPFGNKTIKEFRVPGWIMKATLWQKRLFLASYFGAEMSTPDTLNKYNFYEPTFSMNKLKTLESNALDFLEDIRTLLSDFEVESAPPVLVDGYEYDGKYGTTNGWRVKIHSNSNNLIRFLETINFEYNKKKRKLACLAANYVRIKQSVINYKEKARNNAKSMSQYQFATKQIKEVLVNEIVNERFIERSIYSNTSSARTSDTFPSFYEYCNEYSTGEDGLAWCGIDSIKLVPYEGYVYDVTINDKNHNFLADGIVVSNCGVRVLTTNLKKEDITPKIDALLNTLFKHIPPGVGKKSQFRLSHEEFEDVLSHGPKWAIEKGYGVKEDVEFCEENGAMSEADPSKISEKAKARGIGQLGTLGSGNHFIEIQYVGKIQDKDTAEAFGIHEEGQVVVMIHTGSRGLGHQVCSDYLRKMEKTFPEIVASLPEKDLIYAPAQSDIAKDYYKAMCAAANFAWTNRHMIAHQVRKSFKEVFGKDVELHQIYDVCHNIAKKEKHIIDNEEVEVWVHRKGATRAFGPDNKEIPTKYHGIGQPIFLPGSMGTSSYILVGTNDAMKESFGSTAHGAGRLMSRHAANKIYSGEQVKKDLEEKQDIHIKAASWKGISEEAPGAYKDVDEVVAVSDKAGIGKIVAKLKPMGVIKG
jgi:tRNA-splicing ligase RtcB (3'-phosphate/5'-hydroxy nucleic acid ligase)